MIMDSQQADITVHAYKNPIECKLIFLYRYLLLRLINFDFNYGKYEFCREVKCSI